MDIITHTEATRQGLSYYFTGIPSKKRTRGSTPHSNRPFRQVTVDDTC